METACSIEEESVCLSQGTIQVMTEILYELTSIGSAHAATALSTFLSRPVTMSMPSVRFCHFNRALDQSGTPLTGKHLVTKFYYNEPGSSPSRGIMLVFQDANDASTMYNLITGATLPDIENPDEETRSLFSELGNIMVGNYVSAISNFLQTTVNISPPTLIYHDLDPVVKGSLLEVSGTSGDLFMIRSTLNAGDDKMGLGLVLLFEGSIISSIASLA